MPGYGVEVYRIVNEPDEIVSVLRNGATVICKRVASPVAAIRGYALTGGVYEGKWLGGGLSHLLEHLVAGGSSQRRTETQNKELLQAIGNDSNAYTASDHTAFFINTTAPHFEQAVDLVTGWMLGALITEPEYRREYQVVQRELERNKSNPDYVFYYLLQRNRYLVSPMRVPTIGYQEVIQGLKRDDVYSYYQLAYQPNNMVFSVAANLDPEQMLSIVTKYLSDAKPGRVFSHDIAPEPPVLSPRTVVATYADLGQARVDLTFPSMKASDPDLYALDLVAQVLGGGESSILTQELRDRRQLCSAISCEDATPSYVDGSFMIDMQLDADKLNDAKAAVLAEVEKIRTNGVDPERLARAKAQVKIARLKGMQTSEEIAASMAEDFMNCGDIHFSDHYVDRIGKVTAEEVQAAAKKYLDPGKLITTVLLPRDQSTNNDLPRAEDLLRASSEGVAATQPVNAAEADAPITKTVLDNGLVVLHRRITTTPLVAINMFALGGLAAEDATSNGLGSLAMATLRRGTATRSAAQIAEFFDLTGGDFAATCGNNTWYWTVSCTRDDLDKTMDYLSDVISHPAFDAKEVDHVRTRIMAAIDMQDSAWDAQAFRYFNHQYFGPKGSPYQFDTIGTKKTVAGFSTDEVKTWYFQKILTSPRVVAIFGDLDNAAAVALAQKYFGQGSKLPVAPTPSYPPTAAPVATDHPTVEVERVAIQPTQQELAGVIIGFDSDALIGEPQEAATIVAQTLAGGYGYPTGYIYEILRGRGLVYEAATLNRPGRMPGCFMVYAGCQPKNVNEVVNVILENIARLQGSDQDIQMPWFTRCKDTITTFEALENEPPADQALLASTNEMFGMGYNYSAGFDDRIHAVTVEQVRELAASRLRKCVVTICTPQPDLVKIDPGVRSYSTFSPVDLTPRGVQHDMTPR